MMHKAEDRYYSKRGLFQIDCLPVQYSAVPVQLMGELPLQKHCEKGQLKRKLDLKDQAIGFFRNHYPDSVELIQGLYQDHLAYLASEQVSTETNQLHLMINSFSLDLKTRFHALSANELTICTLLRHNLAAKEVANHLGIGTDSADTSQYRNGKSDNSLRAMTWFIFCYHVEFFN